MICIQPVERFVWLQMVGYPAAWSVLLCFLVLGAVAGYMIGVGSRK